MQIAPILMQIALTVVGYLAVAAGVTIALRMVFRYFDDPDAQCHDLVIPLGACWPISLPLLLLAVLVVVVFNAAAWLLCRIGL